MRNLVSRPTVLSSAIVGNIVGTCDLHTCPSGKKCVQRSNGSPICLTSECPDPPSITSATVTSATRTVNINVSYSCLDGSAGNGNRSTTCKPDGTWTSATLSCPSLTKTTHASSAQGVTETSTVSTFASTSITNGISTSTTLVTTISDSTTQAITTTQSITTTGYEETTPIESDTSAVSDGQQTTTPSKTSIFSDTSSTRVTSADRVSRSTFGATTTKEPGCKDSYTDISSGSVSMCYKVYNDVTDTYDGAKTRCVADGAELMYVRTSDRASVLKTQNGDNQLKNKPYFIDGSDAVVEGVWKHSDGSDVIVALFKKSPTTDNSKNCLAIKNDGQFFDEDCSNSNSFICEILLLEFVHILRMVVEILFRSIQGGSPWTRADSHGSSIWPG
ncbi:uncharacterized protein [Argopecten irradians]|uniref:uncharacterized protein n=1 Tax=Argopecten irradians TaxID=31199 RepID=UPI0037118CF2